MANAPARDAVRALGRATSAARFRISSSPTARWSCAHRIEQARERAPDRASRDVEWRGGAGESATSTSSVAPLLGDDGLLGVERHLRDVTDVTARSAASSRTPSASSRAAYEELQSTNEELETTNEELQSTIEELETTNEELQSTNEELETMNEELQSTNEELETMNDELRHRTLELNEMNAFLETAPHHDPVLAVAVLDQRQYVQTWNGTGSRAVGSSSAEQAG